MCATILRLKKLIIIRLEPDFVAIQILARNKAFSREQLSPLSNFHAAICRKAGKIRTTTPNLALNHGKRQMPYVIKTIMIPTFRIDRHIKV